MTVRVFGYYLNTDHTKSNCGLTNAPLPKQPHFSHFYICDQFLSWETISYCLHLFVEPFCAALKCLWRVQIKVSRQNREELFSAMCTWSQHQYRMLRVDQSNRWPVNVFRGRLLACCHNWPWDNSLNDGRQCKRKKIYSDVWWDSITRLMIVSKSNLEKWAYLHRTGN
jgi:hypothetical protein